MRIKSISAIHIQQMCISCFGQNSTWVFDSQAEKKKKKKVKCYFFPIMHKKNRLTSQNEILVVLV